MNVPDAISSSHSRSYSFWLPSTQWIAAGCVSSAIFSTQRIRCLFVVSGLAVLVFPCFMLLPLLQPLAALCINQLDKQYSLTAGLPSLSVRRPNGPLKENQTFSVPRKNPGAIARQ